MPTTRFTDHELADYERDGFYVVRQLFEPDEIDKLLRFAKEDPSFASSLYGRKDAAGNETKLALWNHAGDDLYSMFARSPRIVDRMEQALGGEVYLYHMKMMSAIILGEQKKKTRCVEILQSTDSFTIRSNIK